MVVKQMSAEHLCWTSVVNRAYRCSLTARYTHVLSAIHLPVIRAALIWSYDIIRRSVPTLRLVVPRVTSPFHTLYDSQQRTYQIICGTCKALQSAALSGHLIAYAEVAT